MPDFHYVARFQQGIILAAQQEFGVNLVNLAVASHGDETRVPVPSVMSGKQRLRQGETFGPGDTRVADVTEEKDRGLLSLLLGQQFLLSFKVSRLCVQLRFRFGHAAADGKSQEQERDQPTELLSKSTTS